MSWKDKVATVKELATDPKSPWTPSETDNYQDYTKMQDQQNNGGK